MKNKIFLLVSLLLVPIAVFAESGGDQMELAFALGMEAFVTIHMSVFVLLPMSKLLSKDNWKKLFITLFVARAAILLFYDFFITTDIAMLDFFMVFLGAFLVVPITALIKTPKSELLKLVNPSQNNTTVTTPKTQITGIELKCAKCNNVLKITDKFCAKCGTPFDGNNVVVDASTTAAVEVPPKKAVHPANFDKVYSLNEDKMLEEFINRELTKAGYDTNSKLIQSDVLKRKNLMNIIFSLLVFVFITLIFFHFPVYTYIIGLIILFISFKSTRKYSLIKYLKKQIQARPNEKISNIVMNAKNTSVNNNSSLVLMVSLILAIALPLVIFSSPRIIYEKTDNGYAVRYYIFGVTNFKTATIPATYKNENVVTLRGNTFSNMPLLEAVSLPDTITEIRGQAFKNCISLKEVNIPEKLEYLGGGAFYNARSLTHIELPNTLTYLGGESFYGANSLETVVLSENLTEIRGDSFEYCSSLKSIAIPDKVTRIGGHAFYADTSLTEVIISENSMLSEIGSSAFRQCLNLFEITIPQSTYVNERAFKESPTRVRRFGEEIEETNNYYNY